MKMENILACLMLFAMPLQADTESEADPSFRIMIDHRVSETEYPQTALDDLALIAEARDWSLADAKAQRKVTEILKELGRTLRAEIGDDYIGAALSPLPGQSPTIYVKGEKQSVLEIVAEGIQVQGNAPYSLSELKSRQKQLHGILINYGYEQIETNIDITSGTVNATVLRFEDPRLDVLVLPASVTERLPASLQSGVSVTIKTESFVNLDASYGGIEIHNSTHRCTTGWVVEDSSGNTGVTTAGHCPTMTEVEHWASGSHSTHDVTLEGSHFGEHGDVSWYSTDSSDLAYFYFDGLANEVREVNSVEAVSDMVIGETVCVYGVASNSRDCSADIESLSASCTYTGHGTVENMILMDDYLTIGGDSGGGWSYANAAYGSTTGSCDDKSIFSPADNYDDAIGVTVLTQ